MNYTRIYNLCILGTGVLLFLSAITDLLASGLDIGVGLVLVGSIGVMISALYALKRPKAANGPTEPNLRFYGIILVFVLMFAGTVLSFL